jgi:hypothetical protein
VLIISERGEQCSVITQKVDGKLVHLFALIKDKRRDKYGVLVGMGKNESLGSVSLNC